MGYIARDYIRVILGSYGDNGKMETTIMCYIGSNGCKLSRGFAPNASTLNHDPEALTFVRVSVTLGIPQMGRLASIIGSSKSL